MRLVIIYQKIITRGGKSMSTMTRILKGKSMDQWLETIENEIVRGSISATLEGKTDFRSGDARCSVRVFERYSWIGKNRVSLCVTLFQKGDEGICLSAISSGGSQAMFFKINTLGEDAFLDKLKALVD